MGREKAIVSVLGLGLIVMLVFGIDIWRNRGAQKAQFDFTGATRPTEYRESPSKGAANPAVVMYEYADFNCSHCGDFQGVIARVLAAHPNEVRLVWKDFPFISQASKNAAVAGRCANAQGKFWEYSNWLFASQKELDSLAFADGAAAFGLDVGSFTACLSDAIMHTLVERDIAEGAALGITETPTLVIGDVALVGTQAFEEVERVLAPLLTYGN